MWLKPKPMGLLWEGSGCGRQRAHMQGSCQMRRGQLPPPAAPGSRPASPAPLPPAGPESTFNEHAFRGQSGGQGGPGAGQGGVPSPEGTGPEDLREAALGEHYAGEPSPAGGPAPLSHPLDRSPCNPTAQPRLKSVQPPDPGHTTAAPVPPALHCTDRRPRCLHRRAGAGAGARGPAPDDTGFFGTTAGVTSFGPRVTAQDAGADFEASTCSAEISRVLLRLPIPVVARSGPAAPPRALRPTSSASEQRVCVTSRLLPSPSAGGPGRAARARALLQRRRVWYHQGGGRHQEVMG